MVSVASPNRLGIKPKWKMSGYHQTGFEVRCLRVSKAFVGKPPFLPKGRKLAMKPCLSVGSHAAVVVAAVSLACSAVVVQGQPRTKVRLLYGFETADDAVKLGRFAEHVEIDTVQDNGVTECAGPRSFGPHDGWSICRQNRTPGGQSKLIASAQMVAIAKILRSLYAVCPGRPPGRAPAARPSSEPVDPPRQAARFSVTTGRCRLLC